MLNHKKLKLGQCCLKLVQWKLNTRLGKIGKTSFLVKEDNIGIGIATSCETEIPSIPCKHKIAKTSSHFF